MELARIFHNDHSSNPLLQFFLTEKGIKLLILDVVFWENERDPTESELAIQTDS